MKITHDNNSNNVQCDKEQEYMLVYEHLLAMERELEIDPTLAEFSEAIYRDIEEFRENYPEIVSEYHFKTNQPTTK